jgi:FixJ family two-component response regulator
VSDSTRFAIAVVDDDPRTLESLANLLEAEGYDVRLYSSAEMIWARGGLAEIDCLISDIGMPNVNGIELRRRALSERPELPVILITGRRELRAQYASIIQRDRYFENRSTVSSSWPPSAQR